MEAQEQFNHMIYIDKEECIGCSHCVRVCPTQALRVWRGKATLDNNKCVDCGDCERVCPVSAIQVKDDFKDQEKQYYRVALIPAVFWGQFPKDIPPSHIKQAVHRLGFDEIVEVEESVEALSRQLQDYVNHHKKEKLISSFCPAIVRLIQTRFPELVSSIAHLKSPVELTAKHISRYLRMEEGDNYKFEIFYITPCAAKAAAIKNSTDETPLIHGSINMDLFFNQINRVLNSSKNFVDSEMKDHLSPKSIGWSLRGGESQFLNANSLSIDGMNHCIEFLENIDKEDFKDIDFLELKACDQGCAGGILNPQNRFLCVESLRSRAKKNSVFEQNIPVLELKKVDFEIAEIEEKSVLALDSNPAQALKMMNKTRRLMCYLPGFDCGACGAPTCKALAEDVAKGNAILSHCVFMQRQMEKHHQLSPSHAFNIIETIWGKDRLDKDCNKKGAINDH
jgi:iron only hydrogenase large subunit-like protein